MTVRQYIAAGIGLVVVLLIAWALRLDHLRAGYKQALVDTVARYTQAQKDAQDRFNAAVATERARNERLNDEADSKAGATAIVYRDRVVRLPAAPTGCAADSAGLPTSDPASRSDGPGADTVILARSDAMICADNTGRLQAAHDWAVAMGEQTTKP